MFKTSFIGVVCSAAVVMIAWVTDARPHDLAAMTDPQRDAWYRSLKSNGGGACCDLTDAAHLDQKNARQMPDRSWQVFLTDLGKWVPVPPDRVVINPKTVDGEPYLFRYPAKLYDGSLIRCFVPPSMGF